MNILSLKNLVFCFCMVLTISCNDDNDKVTPERIITFTAYDSHNAYWVLLSDDEGKTVSWKQLSNDIKEELKYSLAEEVTVTVISKAPNSSFLFLRTFTHVESGDYKLGNADVLTTTPVGSFSLSIPDAFYNFVPQSESYCGDSRNPENTQITMSLCEPSTNLYLALYKNDRDTPHYYYDQEIHPGENLTVDNDLYARSPEMKSKTIMIDKPANGTIIVEGRTIQKKQSFLASIYFTPFAVTSIPIYYPDLIGDLFSDFIFSINYTPEKNVQFRNAKMSKEPADNYPPLDVNFNFSDSSKITTESLEFPITGQAQYVFAAFNYFDNSNINNPGGWWYIYTEFTNNVSVQLPSFPDDLKTTLNFSFLGKMKRNQVNFVENIGAGGYSGFYKKRLGVGTSGSVDLREKIYRFNNTNSIVSGGRLFDDNGNGSNQID